AITELNNTSLVVQHNGRQATIPFAHLPDDAGDGVQLVECPAARHAGFDLPLSPHAFAHLGLETAEPVLRAGLEFHQRHVSIVEQALGNMHRYAPSTFDRFSEGIRLAALKPRTWGGYDDFSHPELPGSFLASV